MKGRSTTCITIRLDDSIVQSLQERAIKQGLSTAGEYVKAQILKGINHSVITTGLPPIYNKAIHKPGDRVRIRQGKGLVERIVPEVDGGGYELYDGN